MEDVFLSLFRALNDELPEVEARERVYTEMLEAMIWHDPELVENLATEDQAFGESYRQFRGSEEEDESHKT